MEDQDAIEMVAFTHIEVTLTEPLSAGEAFHIITAGERMGTDISINSASRIVLFDTDEIEDVTEILSDIGAIETIGMIKVISTFEPNYGHYLIEFEEE